MDNQYPSGRPPLIRDCRGDNEEVKVIVEMNQCDHKVQFSEMEVP